MDFPSPDAQNLKISKHPTLVKSRSRFEMSLKCHFESTCGKTHKQFPKTVLLATWRISTVRSLWPPDVPQDVSIACFNHSQPSYKHIYILYIYILYIYILYIYTVYIYIFSWDQQPKATTGLSNRFIHVFFMGKSNGIHGVCHPI